MRNWLSGSICFVIVALCGIAFAQQAFYSIHISSHKQQAKAGTEVKKLKNLGLDAFVRHVEVQGKGMWYRIYVGKYATKQEAAGDIDRLRKMKLSDYFAVRKLSEEKPAAAAAAPAATTAPKARPAAPKTVNYYLFVGFYRDLDPTQKEVARLATALATYGYSVFSTREDVPDGVNYRVYIGTYTDRQQATASGAELKDKKILTSFYIPVPTTQDMVAGRMPDIAAGTAAAAAAAAAAATEEKQKTPDKVPDDEPAAEKKATAARFDDFSRFALMLKGGAFSPQKTDDFSVAIGGTTYRVSDDPAPQIGVEAVLRFNKTIGLYGTADTVFIDGIDWYNFAAGPILTFQTRESVMPYLKGGAVYGDFSWDAPGEFDSSLGWEGAAGFNFFKSKFKLGVEIAYRSMSFDYKPPSGAIVTPADNSLDLSGFSVMATFSYWF